MAAVVLVGFALNGIATALKRYAEELYLSTAGIVRGRLLEGCALNEIATTLQRNTTELPIITAALIKNRLSPRKTAKNSALLGGRFFLNNQLQMHATVKFDSFPKNHTRNNVSL